MNLGRFYYNNITNLFLKTYKKNSLLLHIAFCEIKKGCMYLIYNKNEYFF